MRDRGGESRPATADGYNSGFPVRSLHRGADEKRRGVSIMHPTLTIAIKAARRAGNLINRNARDLDLLTVTAKGPKDFVSEIDRAAEHAIVETLLDAYPGHAILA